MLTPGWVAAVMVLAALAGPAPAAELREVRSAEGRFTIRLPGRPGAVNRPTPAGLLHALQVKSAEAEWTVSWVELPAEVKPPASEARLDAIRDRLALRLQGRVVQEKKVRLGKKDPGRDILLDLGPSRGRLRTRVFLAGGRLYQVTVQGSKEAVESPQAEKVFDSFTLTR
jgi:hypothetical protein